jgi:hypothetical protein
MGIFSIKSYQKKEDMHGSSWVMQPVCFSLKAIGFNHRLPD